VIARYEPKIKSRIHPQDPIGLAPRLVADAGIHVLVTPQRTPQADALLFGRVTYGIMESAFRPPARVGVGPGARPAPRPDWMEPFARTIDVIRGAIEASRLEAREPAGVQLGGGGDAV